MSMPADTIFWIVTTISVMVMAMLFYKQIKRKRRDDLFTAFSKLGSRNNLSFTGQEVLAGGLIGFDGRKKKLLVLENTLDGYRWYTINLDEVKGCLVQKTYRLPDPNQAAPRSVSAYVDRVELQFHFRNGEQPRRVRFYEAQSNEVEELPGLEAKAASWNCFLSKLLPARQNGRA